MTPVRRRSKRTDVIAAAAATDSDLLMSAGGRFGRDAVVYGIAIGVALPFGLAGVIVFTRYLSPSEYGHLAVLLVGSALLTILYNLPTLMGIMAVAYGAGAGADEDADADAGDSAPVLGGRSGETLTTGLVVTLATAAPPTIVLALLAPQIAGLIAGPELTNAVRWAVLSAAAGALFRLVLNVPRMEHRPVLYSWLSTSRPAFALAIGATLVIGGRGADGVVAGLAIGTLLAAATALAVTITSYAPRVSLDLLPAILKHGWRTAPMIASTWTLQNVDLLVLSRYASDAAVGSYRVANRLAAFVLYGVSAFLMTMGPVQQTSLFKAADDTVGQLYVRGLLVRYFAIGGIYIVLLVALASDALFLLAAPAYRDASALVALIAAGFITYGLARVLGRTAPVRRRSSKSIRGLAVAAVCFVPLCFVLIPLAGREGAAAAMLVTTAGLCAWWALLTARAPERLDIGWPRVLAAAALATACYGLSVVTGDGWRVAADAAIALLVCPGLFVLSGVVPLRHVKPLASIVGASVRPGHRKDVALQRRIAELDGSDLLQIRKGLVISSSANARLMARPNDLEHFVHVLRQIGHVGEKRAHDGHIGAHLVLGGSYAEVQARAESLRARGVDAAELYRLEDVFARTRRVMPLS